MISQIQIKNFKSIVDLTLDLGRVNLFIGENGSGKSNILEAVGFASSTSNGKINDSILLSKGVRVNQSELYESAFDEIDGYIEVNFTIDNFLLDNRFRLEDQNEWNSLSYRNYYRALNKLLFNIGTHVDNIEKVISLENIRNGNFESKIDFTLFKKDTPPEIKSLIESQREYLHSYNKNRQDKKIQQYILYSPENSALRKFDEEGQVKPLGFRGEGLFSLLKSMASENGGLQHIKERLEVIDWFEDFSIPNDLMSNEFRISIKDRFINSDLKYFDQRSANEGFLFLLFYVVLFSSKKTPQFFAIDNIEASFNPKLCAKLINMLVDLSKKNEKQVLMTTHNPSTIDGLNLNDPEQKLFVVERNIDGHTIVTRITEKPKTSTPMKLSEMWTKGFLGGLPDNF